MIASMSWISSRPTTTSPMCLWCSTVVGSSFTPRMVLEKVTATPATSASATLKPKASVSPKPIAKKAAEVPSAVTKDLPSMVFSVDGCMSSPIRKSRKMMPNSAISASSWASLTTDTPCGPSRQPMAM